MYTTWQNNQLLIETLKLLIELKSVDIKLW